MNFNVPDMILVRVSLGSVYDTGGRPVEMDTSSVRVEFHLQLAGVRLYLVVDSGHARRPAPRELGA